MLYIIVLIEFRIHRKVIANIYMAFTMCLNFTCKLALNSYKNPVT